MTTRFFGTAILLATSMGLALAVGCSDDTADGATDCEGVTVKGYAELSTTAFTKCTNCHSSMLTGAARNAAPMGADYNTYDLAKAQASKISTRLKDASASPMPPSGYPPLAEAEKDDLINWADCGTPQ